MKISLSLALLLMPLLTIAQTQNFTFKVNGADINPKIKLYLAYQAEGKKIIDSAVQQNGAYVFNGRVARPLNATLVVDNDGLGIQQLMLRTKKGIDITALKLYIHPGEFSLTTDRQLHNQVFDNSSVNTDNLKLQAELKYYEDEQLRISNQLRAGGLVKSVNDNSPEKQATPEQSQMAKNMVKQLDSLHAATKPIYKHFAQANPDSYVALLALQTYAGSPPKVDEILPLFENLSENVRNTDAGKDYLKFLMDNKNLVAGVAAPLFTQNDTDGKPVSLASFKGKYVLLDFWASWCGPCRANNPALVKIYNHFKDKKFAILGISLDEADGKKYWLKAIKDDKLTWTQLSDLKHWDNQVVKLYGVSAIPQNFLIDPNGVIIAKGLAPDVLRNKLQQLLHD